MDNKFSIAFKIRPKHGKIYTYMIENNLNLEQMSNLIGISVGTLINMLHFKWGWSNRRDLRIVKKLEKFFKCSIKELFPTELTNQIETNKEIKKLLQTTSVIEKGIDIEYLPFYSLPQIEYTPDFDKFELTDILNNALKRLTLREEKVLRMRFIDEYTQDKIGKELNIHKARVGQIEAKALRKLRKSSQAKKLRDFTDSEFNREV